MREFKSIDPTALKAFFYASNHLNFTRAAQAAGMTQSGVSQYIAKLESQLEVSLFHRIKKSIHLSDEGEQLKQYAEKYLDAVDQLYASIKLGAQQLYGEVRYAMPHSCLMTPHFPMLLDLKKDFENVQLKVSLCSSSEVITKLVASEIDFGFITEESDLPELEYLPFASEEHVLVSHAQSSLKIKNSKDILEKGFVVYPGFESLFKSWYRHNFTKSKVPHIKSLNLAGEISSLEGARHMVRQGVGLTICPRHCLSHNCKESDFKILDLKKASSNPIYIVTLKSVKPSQRVKAVLNAFETIKNSK